MYVHLLWVCVCYMHVFMTVNTLYDIILTYILHTQIVTAIDHIFHCKGVLGPFVTKKTFYNKICIEVCRL